MAGLVRIEVTDEHGSAVRFAGASGLKLSPAKRDRLAAIADGLVAGIELILGCDADHARNVAMADLTRMLADDEAYERVAARRGLLPL